MIERFLRARLSDIYSRRDGYRKIVQYEREFDTFIKQPTEEIKRLSLKHLNNILVHACNTSPYYSEICTRICIDAGNLDPLNALNKLPILTREIIEKNKDMMISGQYKKETLETSQSGGSSGTPTSFYRDKKCTAMRIGRQRAILHLCGYSPGDRNALIWGMHEDVSSSSGMSMRQKLRKFAAGKEPLCCTILDRTIMREYHSRLLKFKPDVLYGYPNAMSLFAEYIREQGMKPVRVKTIICTAERLTEMQRDLLSDTFGGEVFNLYCTREHGCIGFECKKHRGFHLDIGSVFIEIIRDGRPVEPGIPGEIVITDLLNYGMPFIRNKIGDWGSLSARLCDCGNPLPLLEDLGGRETEMLLRPDGRIVSGIMLVDIFTDEKAIKEMQIIQDHIREIRVNLVVDDQNYSMNTQNRVTEEIRKILGQEMDIHINVVPEIPRNPNSGKYQEVICRIKNCDSERLE